MCNVYMKRERKKRSEIDRKRKGGRPRENGGMREREKERERETGGRGYIMNHRHSNFITS